MKKPFVCCLLVIFIFCGSFFSVGLTAAEQVTLVFYHKMVGESLLALRNLIKGFQEENPRIKIKPQFVGDALQQKLATTIAAGTPPDLAWLNLGMHEVLVEGGAIIKMEDFIRGKDGLTQEDIDDIRPSLRETATYKSGEEMWCMPVEATTMTFVYNKNMFREAGLDPENPKMGTWEELAETAAKLTDPVKKRWGMFIPIFTGDLSAWFDWFFRPFIWAGGGSFINEEGTKVEFNEEKARRAVQYFYDLQYKYNAGTFMPPDQAFQTGKVGIHFEGSWSLPALNQLRFEWNSVLYPEGPAGRFHPAGGENVVIFKASKHQEEAWKFVKYWVRPDVQARWAIDSGYLPMREAVAKDQQWLAHVAKIQGLQGFNEGMRYARNAEWTPEWNRVVSIYADYVQEIMHQKIELVEGLDEAAEKCNKIIDEYWAEQAKLQKK